MAADSLKNGPFDRDVEQAITALKKGTHLLKYGQRGKPKFCPFRLSNDETVLIWYSGRMEKQLNLNQVSKIIPGQRTAIFLRHPRPDKEYQSFSLIYGQRSLDLVHELTHKSELLEAELDKTNNQLREARTTVDVESLKCKAAKEVISSLTSQIKSTTERAPEGCTINGTWTDQVSKLLGSQFCENHLNDFSRSPPDSSGHLVHQLPCKGNSTVTDTEWIEQVEHGVYITLFRSPAGHKYLRRVRFSKRRFTEQQAERWWAEHRSTLQQQYGILTGDSIIPSRTIREKG